MVTETDLKAVGFLIEFDLSPRVIGTSDCDDRLHSKSELLTIAGESTPAALSVASLRTVGDCSEDSADSRAFETVGRGKCYNHSSISLAGTSSKVEPLHLNFVHPRLHSPSWTWTARQLLILEHLVEAYLENHCVVLNCPLLPPESCSTVVSPVVRRRAKNRPPTVYRLPHFVLPSLP